MRTSDEELLVHTVRGNVKESTRKKMDDDLYPI